MPKQIRNPDSKRFSTAMIGSFFIHSIILFGLSFGGWQLYTKSKDTRKILDATIVSSNEFNEDNNSKVLAEKEYVGKQEDANKAFDQEMHNVQQHLASANPTNILDLTEKSTQAITTPDFPETTAKQRSASLNTKEDAYAKYVANWRRLIEEYGNQHYPSFAKAHNLNGKVMLLVLINKKGRVKNIRVLQSSGNQALDKAAIDSVHEAEPYPAFPKNLSKDYEQIAITRVWDYRSAG